MSQPQRARDGSDAGFTLIEMLIYLAFTVVVLTLVGGMLINALNAQRSISSRSEATTSGQAIAQSVHAGVRAGVNHRLTSTGVAADTDQLLVVQTLSLDHQPGTCLAWFYTAQDGAVYYQRAAGDALITAPHGEDYTGWLLLATNVHSVGGIFNDTDSGDGTRIALSFTVAVGENSPPVRIASTTISRDNRSETTQCWE